MFKKNERGQAGLVLTVIGVAVALVAIWLFLALHRVSPGNVGVIVHYNREGAIAGRPVIEAVPTGKWVLIDVVQDSIAQYPIAQQTLTMVRAEGEGEVAGDDSVKCQDNNGVPVYVDSSTLWRVDPEKAGELYILRPNVQLTGNQGADIASLVVRREIRFAITTACSEFTYDGIYGDRKQAFTDRVNTILGDSLTKTFILLDNFLTGEIHLLPAQETAINNKVVAQQAAQQAAFLAEQRENEAAARIAQAEGEAEAIRILNEQLAESPFYISYLYALAWNGELPVVLTTGGDSLPPMIQLPEALLGTPQGTEVGVGGGASTGADAGTGN